jgi:hypothetical protein
LRESLRRAGFAKDGWQNLDVKELKHQNPENKGLRLSLTGRRQRHALDHDYALLVGGERLDVTA